MSQTPGDLGDQYNSFLDVEEISESDLGNGDVVIKRDGKLLRPKRLASNLYQFRAGTGEDRCVLDSITSLQNGADLLWIETEKPHIGQIGGMVHRIREVIPNAKLVYNNSPSFNWTLNFRQQVYDLMVEMGRDVSAYDRAKLMSVDYDGTDLAAVQVDTDYQDPALDRIAPPRHVTGGTSRERRHRGVGHAPVRELPAGEHEPVYVGGTRRLVGIDDEHPPTCLRNPLPHGQRVRERIPYPHALARRVPHERVVHAVLLEGDPAPQRRKDAGREVPPRRGERDRRR